MKTIQSLSLRENVPIYRGATRVSRSDFGVRERAPAFGRRMGPREGAEN